jgi:enolase
MTSEDALKLPDLFISLLQGGEKFDLKCKVYKFIICLTNEIPSTEKASIIEKVVAELKNQIISGKGGQSALNFFHDGTINAVFDSVMENLKLISNAIEQLNVNDKVSVGIVW